MGRVFSFNTGKDIVAQNFGANEKLVLKGGRYAGVLPQRDAKTFHKFQDKLICDRAQINELISEYDEDYALYISGLIQAFLYMGIDPEKFPFNPETDDVFINKDGHVWVVSTEGGKQDE